MEFNAAERTSLRIRTEISGTIEIKLSGISGKPIMHGELLSNIGKAQHISLLFWMDMKEHHESAKNCMFSILIRVFTYCSNFWLVGQLVSDLLVVGWLKVFGCILL